MSALDLWRRAKAECPPETLVMLRDGDFYLLFGEDAETAAPVLGECLVLRTGVPMCVVRYREVEEAIRKLLLAGKKVALGDPILAASLGRKEA